jgi:hypothetical protein
MSAAADTHPEELPVEEDQRKREGGQAHQPLHQVLQVAPGYEHVALLVSGVESTSWELSPEGSGGSAAYCFGKNRPHLTIMLRRILVTRVQRAPVSRRMPQEVM